MTMGDDSPKYPKMIGYELPVWPVIDLPVECVLSSQVILDMRTGEVTCGHCDRMYREPQIASDEGKTIDEVVTVTLHDENRTTPSGDLTELERRHDARTRRTYIPLGIISGVLLLGIAIGWVIESWRH